MITTIILDWAGTAVDYGCFAPVDAFAAAFAAFGVYTASRLKMAVPLRSFWRNAVSAEPAHSTAMHGTCFLALRQKSSQIHRHFQT